jgi:tetratricopeptide (TPR) repeat protein
MLCKFSKVEEWRLRVGFLPILLSELILILALMTRTPTADAQVSNLERQVGDISGTVLSEVDNQPATQVAVCLKSHAGGIFRSVLTDFAGHFEVRSLPPGKYEINIEEAGFEPTQASAQLEGSPVKLVLKLKPSRASQPGQGRFAVSVRELKISDKARDEYKKGLESLGKKDWPGSLNHFTKATKASPEYYEAYYHLGLTETNLGHLNEAMQAFQKAADSSGGQYAWADFGVGYVLYLEGKAREAETVLRRGLEVDNNSPDGHVILGMTLLRLDNPEEAEKCAREALLRNPNFAQAYLLLADSFARRHNYREQLQGLETYLKLEPDGAASERSRQVRDVVLKILANSQSSN